MYKSLKNYWDQCPDDVQSSYGKEYFEQFKVNVLTTFKWFFSVLNEFSQESLGAHMKGAKPASKITEVVDDMLDAVAGAEPLVFVKPNVSDDQ